MLYYFAKGLALPPAILIIGLVVGLCLTVRWRRAGLAVLWTTVVIFYLMAAPFSANRLAARIATVPPLSQDANLAEAQAIVVLSAGAYQGAPEYAGIRLDSTTLERLRYAAHLYRKTSLPVLVSGGIIRGVPSSLADAMKTALEHDFAVPVTWIEDQSADTMENARFSAEILQKAGVHSIVLVTHASHMPRALRLFESTGLKVLPAPTSFPPSARYMPADLIPRMAAFAESEEAIYEILGRIWHRLY